MSDKLSDFFKSFADAEASMEVKIASDSLGNKPQVISTGSPSLDDALCGGGVCRGRITQLYGKPGSGKTAMSILLIKEAQKQDPESRQLYIDAEGTFSPAWCEKLGADPSKVVLIQDDLAVSAKRCFEMLTGIPKEDKSHFFAGKSKKGLLDEVAEGNLKFNLIILDSVRALQVPQEQISEVGKINISPVPRFLSTALKKLSLDVKKANVAMVMINHVRNTMNMYGPDHASAGGNSYHHFLAANIYFEMVARKDAEILNEKEEKIGHTIRATIEKNKVGVWPRKCEFAVDFTKGIVGIHKEIGELALQYDIVQKPTSMSYIYKDYKWVGANNYYQALLENAEITKELLEKIETARYQKYFSKKFEMNKVVEGSKVVEKPKKSGKIKLEDEQDGETV